MVLFLPEVQFQLKKEISEEEEGFILKNETIPIGIQMNCTSINVVSVQHIFG